MSDEEQPLLDKSEQEIVLSRSRVRTLVKQCQKRSEAYVLKLFEQFAKQLRKDLLKLSETTHEFTKAQRYNEAMRLLRNEHESLAEQFSSNYSKLLNQALHRFDKEDESDEVQEGSLSLVGETQLEESLVIEQITSKIFEHYSDELFALEQRLSLLLPRHNMDEGKIPFGSATLCSVWEEVLEPLEFDIKTKLATYRSLERCMLESIGTLYGELNDLLSHAGVMPEIKRTVKKSATSEQPHSQSTEPVHHQNSSDGGDNIANSGINAVAPENSAYPPQQGGHPNPIESAGNSGGNGTVMSGGVPHEFQGIQQLAGLFSEGSVAKSAEQVALVSAPVTPQLIEALSGLQTINELFEPGAELSGEALKARIKAQLSGGEGTSPGGISQLDDETIDVISMIFDDLMDDEHLPDRIKALLGRLQIPVLKVAIIDRVFFSQKDHPARQLLNALTVAGQVVNIESDVDEQGDLVYKKIESIVMHLVHEFQGDFELFETCLIDFCAFMDEQQAGFQEAKLEIGGLAQESSFNAKADKESAEKIADKLLKREVPEDIKAFLMGSWHQVLSTIIRNEGADSEAFQRAEQMAGDLVWSVAPLKSSEGKKKLLAVIPVILDVVTEGLQMIGHTEPQIQGVIKTIERYHITNISRGVPSSKPLAESVLAPQPVDEVDRLLRDLADELDLSVDELTNNDDLSLVDGNDSGEFEKMMQEMGIDQEKDLGPKIDDKYTVLAAALEEGSWVELLDDEGVQRRTKLAWKGDEFTKYAFVNWRYKVVAEKSYYALADEFRQGNATIIEELPLFDRAFDSVFTKIMRIAG